MRDGLPALWFGLLGIALAAWGALHARDVVVQRTAATPAPTLETLGPYRPELVVLPAGSFVMGSPEGEEGRDKNEKQHKVTLTRAFALGRTEVTQGQWAALMGNNPSFFQGKYTGGPEHPVEWVNWYEALAYLNRLSEVEGLPPCYRLEGPQGTLGGGCGEEDFCDGDFRYERVEFLGLDCPGYRLPTEAEWEYAARASTIGAVYAGEWKVLGENNAPVLDPLAWYGGNSGTESGVGCSGWPEKQYPEQKQCGTHPVRRKQANAWGLHDMLGNVWEWTQDTHVAELLDATDPLQAERLPYGRCVSRGCGWAGDARDCRAATRDHHEAVMRTFYLGLRPARSFP